MGSYIGAWKRVAALAGVPLDEYLGHLDRGEHWCGACRSFHPAAEFGSDASRAGGRTLICRTARNALQRRIYIPKRNREA